MSLVGKTVEWTLADKGALNQLISPTQVTLIMIDAPNGHCHVRVPSEITARVPSGRHFDATRVTDSDSRSDTILTGVCYIDRTGFAALYTAAIGASAILTCESTLYADATVTAGMGG